MESQRRVFIHFGRFTLLFEGFLARVGKVMFPPFFLSYFLSRLNFKDRCFRGERSVEGRRKEGKGAWKEGGQRG